MKFINLTPHTVNIFNTSKKLVLSLQSSGVARRQTNRIQAGAIDGIPLFVTEFGDTIGLLPEDDDTRYVVSLLVRDALPERTDLYAPGELVRDESGQPIGCIGLSR